MRQVERRRRDSMGARRAGAHAPSRQERRGSYLRRQRVESRGWDGRSIARARGRRRQPASRAILRAQRSRGHAARVSLGRIGIPAQQDSVPLEGHHRIFHGRANSQPRLLAGRAGPNRRNYPGQAARAAHSGRGSRGPVAVQGPARDERAQARAREGKSRARRRRAQRNRASAKLRAPAGEKS